MSDRNVVVDLQQFSFSYSGGKQPVRDGISFCINEGETVLILGPSGCGKSTLALGLSGLIPQAIVGDMQGQVWINNLNTRETEPGKLAKIVGTVFQDPEAQAVMMTVEDEVAFGLENIGVAPEEMEKRIVDALQAVGLLELRDESIDRLSGGQKQRLALASILSMQPKILVLDEPTANLDPVSTKEVFHILRRLKATGQYTIILVEHKLDDLVDVIDRVIVMDDNGQVVCSGDPEHIFHDYAQKLRQLGVWFPQAVEAIQELRASGYEINSRALSIEQLALDLRHDYLIRENTKANEGSYRQNNNTIFSNSLDNREHKGASTSLNKINTSMINNVEKDNAIFFEFFPTHPPAPKEGWLKPLKWQVKRGEFWAIVGENGAGKTTLARHIMGLLPVSRGVLSIEGRDASSYPISERARRIGYVFQNPEHQFVTERVWDEIAFSMQRTEMSENDIATRVEMLLTKFGLTEYADAHPFCLSHGQKRRLSVAVMLTSDQELLILDEPTFGQDRRHAEELMEMLRELHLAGHTILMITHDMSLVAQYAQYVAVLTDGELLTTGSIEQLFFNSKLMSKAGLTLPPIAELSQILEDIYPIEDRTYSYTLHGWIQQWRNLRMTRKEGAMHL